MASVKKKDPMPPFTHTLDWWEHPDTGVRFDNPRYETHPDPTGKPTDVVVWTGHCCVDSCHETFRSAHRLPPDGYPKGMPTPQRLSRMTRTRCEYHARLAQNRGEDWGPPETGTVFEGTDGREWILQAYAEVPTLTGGVFTTAVWEGACVVPGCSASLEWRTRAQPLGRPLQGNPPRYCHAHHGGRLGEAPSAQEREWFAEKNAAKKERWVAICAEGRKKAAQARKEKYEKAGPEEKTRMALERAARVKKWSDACIQGRREARARRKEEEAHLPFEEQERIKAEKRAKIKPWLEACAKGRVARSLAYQTAGAEEKARLMADALAKVNAPTVNAPTANAPAPAPTASAPAPAPTANAPAPRQPVTVSAPPVTASAPPPTAAEVEGVRARREANAVYNLLAAHTAPATPTPENISPEYLALYRWVAKRIGKEPVFGIKTPPPTPADASAIVALFERMPLAVTLEWEGAWRMAHRVVKNLHTDRQLANREEARVNVREQAFNDAFGWQPGHNCYWRPTEEKLLEKALKESKPELVRASATLDRVRKQVEELPVRALTEDVAQAEVDLMAQEIEAEEALARVQERRKPMQDRKAEFDAEKKTAEEKHKREMAEAEYFRKIDAAERAANPPKAKTADDENSYYE